jgi:hypothetical protein
MPIKAVISNRIYNIEELTSFVIAKRPIPKHITPLLLSYALWYERRQVMCGQPDKLGRFGRVGRSWWGVRRSQRNFRSPVRIFRWRWVWR